MNQCQQLVHIGFASFESLLFDAPVKREHLMTGFGKFRPSAMGAARGFRYGRRTQSLIEFINQKPGSTVRHAQRFCRCSYGFACLYRFQKLYFSGADRIDAANDDSHAQLHERSKVFSSWRDGFWHIGA
ncbi:hypothetical protein COAQ111491_12100 [Comamonas aquatilis]